MSLYSDLVRKELNGWFQRKPEYVKEAERLAENARGRLHYDDVVKSLEEANARYRSLMTVFDYDEHSGLFVATGSDWFGESVVCGVIRGTDIGFEKSYKRGKDQTTFSVESPLFRTIRYRGSILTLPEGGIVLAGEYQPVDYNKSMRGDWELSTRPVEIDEDETADEPEGVFTEL